MEKLLFKGSEIVVLDDQWEEAADTGSVIQNLHDKIKSLFGVEPKVYVATTPAQWEMIHEAEGVPLMVLHDWDISGLYGQKNYFPFTVISSVKAFLDKQVPTVLYTAGSLEKAKLKFSAFEELHFVQKGDAEGLLSLLSALKSSQN